VNHLTQLFNLIRLYPQMQMHIPAGRYTKTVQLLALYISSVPDPHMVPVEDPAPEFWRIRSLQPDPVRLS